MIFPLCLCRCRIKEYVAGVILITVITILLCPQRAVFADQELESRIQRVENGILGAVQTKSRPLRIYSIKERMDHYCIPGVSVSVVNDGRVEWARGYGVAETGTDKKINAARLSGSAE